MDADPDILEYFIFSFTADFGEIIKDYIVEYFIFSFTADFGEIIKDYIVVAQ